MSAFPANIGETLHPRCCRKCDCTRHNYFFKKFHQTVADSSRPYQLCMQLFELENLLNQLYAELEVEFVLFHITIVSKGVKRYKSLGAKGDYACQKNPQFHSRTPHKLLPNWQQRCILRSNAQTIIDCLIRPHGATTEK